MNNRTKRKIDEEIGKILENLTLSEIIEIKPLLSMDVTKLQLCLDQYNRENAGKIASKIAGLILLLIHPAPLRDSDDVATDIELRKGIESSVNKSIREKKEMEAEKSTTTNTSGFLGFFSNILHTFLAPYQNSWTLNEIDDPSHQDEYDQNIHNNPF